MRVDPRFLGKFLTQVLHSQKCGIDVGRWATARKLRGIGEEGVVDFAVDPVRDGAAVGGSVDQDYLTYQHVKVPNLLQVPCSCCNVVFRFALTHCCSSARVCEDDE